jgi:hypothetical protein
MLIEVTPTEATDALVDYLRRLGCTVQPVERGRVSTSVTYPETVSDESRCLGEWCRSWSKGDRRAVCVADGNAG